MPSTATRVPANAAWYDVAPGTAASFCNGAVRGGQCTARFYWTSNPKTGKAIPVDCDVEGGTRPSESKDLGQLDMPSGEDAPVHPGRSVSHFLTCCDADLFTRGAR